MGKKDTGPLKRLIFSKPQFKDVVVKYSVNPRLLQKQKILFFVRNCGFARQHKLLFDVRSAFHEIIRVSYAQMSTRDQVITIQTIEHRSEVNDCFAALVIIVISNSSFMTSPKNCYRAIFQRFT